MGFISLRSISTFLHQCLNPLDPVILCLLFVTRIGKWLWMMNIMLLLKIKRGSWCPVLQMLTSTMWIFAYKEKSDGSFERHKARLVGDSKTQQVGMDCGETFSSVVKPVTIHAVLSLALSKAWSIHQLDVKNAFVHGELREMVYMYQPLGYRDRDKPDHVCLQKKSLYGLKQALRPWYKRFVDYIHTLGFSHNTSDHSLFIYRSGISMAYILLYVDDIILTASSNELRQSIISLLSSEFAMKDLGPLSYFLGIAVTRHSGGLFLSQKKYAT